MKTRCILRTSCVAVGLYFGIVGASQAVTVMFDINASGSPTQAGWTAAPGGAGSNGTVSIVTRAIGGAFVDTRNRGTDSGGGVELAMWNDFVFGNQSFTDGGTPTGDGLEVQIIGLAPSTTYPIQIWSYDVLSGTDDRITEWAGGGGAATISFFGQPSANPTSLADHTIAFLATSDGAGDLLLTGTPASGGAPPPFSHNVFINGLQIGDPIPEPSSAILALSGLALFLLRRRR